MRIKRVEIIGFKSFCDRAVVNIGESITGVVGPNGCGKSNIVDSIRWCMGEQSAKHLRGKAMEDVIFAGSESRGPAPMAEVSLTFDDVGFSHEKLELAKHSDEAEAERALAALGPDEGSESLVSEPATPGDAVDAAVAAVAAAPEAAAEAGLAEPTKSVWVDAEGNRIASPQDEVNAVLDDAPPAFDFARYTEVTITRRLYRDGISQYFINKTPCRLRDITDFFLGTGVGTKAYAIIEQGRIGQIVSARPQDRRAIIEEAAGITKFKAKKKAAEKKLEQTRQNLMRVSDIVAELDKRMGSLRRQAQKAERYRKYKAEVKDIELWKASHRWLELTSEWQNVTGRLGEARLELEEARTAWTTKDAHLIAERAELAVEERRLHGIQELVYELENRLRLGESKIGFERREAEELDGRVAGARSEIDEVAVQRATGAEELATRASELATLEEEVARESAEVASREAAAGEARQMMTNAQGRLDEARIELAKRRTEIATAEAQLEALARRREEAERRLGRVMEETELHTTRVKELEREGRRVDGALVELRQTRLDLGSQRESFEARRELLADETQRGESQVDTLRTDLQRKTSRLTSLEEIQERYEGFARGTRAVMQQADSISSPASAIHGVVADVVRAPERLEVAVEAALGDRLGGVLVSEPEVGIAAIAFLKTGSGGRSAFVPLRDSVANKVGASGLGPRASTEEASTPEAASRSLEASAPEVGSGAETAGAPPSRRGFEGEGGPSSWVSPAWDPAGAPAPAYGSTTTFLVNYAATRISEDAGHLTSDGLAAGEVMAAGEVVSAHELAGDEMVSGEARGPRPEAPTILQQEGVIGLMSDLVAFADGYEAVGKRLLAGVIVVEDLACALALHKAGVTERLITLDGDVVDQDGVVAGGSRDALGAGVLAQKREIRDLEESVGRLEHELAEASALLLTAKAELKQVTKAVEGLRTQAHEGDIAIMSHEKDETRVRADLERARDRLGHLGTEQLELEERLRVIGNDEQGTRERRESAESRIGELERIQLDLISDASTHRDRLEELQQVLTEARIRSAQLGEKRAAAESATLRLQRADADFAARTERLAVEIDDAAHRATTLRESCDTLAAELATVREQRDTEVASLDEGRVGYQQRNSDLVEVEMAARELRTRADKLNTEVSGLEVREGQVKLTRHVVEEQIDERYQLEMSSIVHDFHQRPLITEVEDARLTELRDLIERMGTDINLTAIEEFAEVSQRFEFLSAQKTDLERAVDQLQRAIDKINKTSRKLFKDTFDAVNATFKQVFPRLFRGGQAALSLTGVTERGDRGAAGEGEPGAEGAPRKEKEIDLLEAGIEIMAQPPGKKNSTVEQLSGGEKALTAVALVFSIFLIKPSPFCILDEVDAPLDEANVDRYNEIVREMTDRSQFIVITHNKRTMEAADNLYGVTMQEPGVSKLVSVNLSRIGQRAASSSASSGAASAPAASA